VVAEPGLATITTSNGIGDGAVIVGELHDTSRTWPVSHSTPGECVMRRQAVTEEGWSMVSAYPRLAMWYVVRSKCGLRSPPPTGEDEEELVSEAAKRPLRRSRCCISHKRTICGAAVPISLGNSDSYRRHGDGVDANGRDRPFLRASRGGQKSILLQLT
jgi:hypothetical protein